MGDKGEGGVVTSFIDSPIGQVGRQGGRATSMFGSRRLLDKILGRGNNEEAA